MRKFIKYLGNIIFGVIAAVLIVYIVGMQFFPAQIKEFVGYQTYVVLTDSMEPVIPVGSLVLSKTIQDGQEIPKDTIISFHVDRLGKDVIFTHYFKKKEVDGTGRERYYTQAENADRYDDYATYREDLLGTYVCHVPKVGKFVLFLQSPFALLELGIIGIILIVYNILWARFDAQEQRKAVLIETEEAKTVEAATEPVAAESAEESVEPRAAEPERRMLFGYAVKPYDDGHDAGRLGFDIDIYTDGTIQYRMLSLEGQELTAGECTVSKKSAKRIRQILKENAPVIREIPDVLDNGFCVGDGQLFKFGGRWISGVNVRHSSRKKMRRESPAYYGRYHENMEYENKVLEIFEQAGETLKEEGICLKTDFLKIREKQG